MGRWHAASIEAAGGDVVSIVDVNPEAAASLASRVGTSPVASASLKEALSGGDVDVLHVCTAVNTHAEFASLALQRGVHVIVEKPLAATAAETKALISEAGKRGLLIAPVHQYIFQRGMLEIIERLDQIGEIQSLAFSICSAGGERTTASLDSIVDEILPHPLSVAFALGVEGVRDLAVLSARAGEMTALWNSAGGQTVSIAVSMSGRPPHNRAILSGTRGTAHFDFFHGYSFIERGWRSRWRKAAAPFEYSSRTLFAGGTNLLVRAGRRESAYPGLRELINRFYDAVAKGGPSPISAEAVLSVAEMRDEVIQLAAAARARR